MADDAAPEKPEILMRLALPRRVLLKEGDGGHMGSDMGGLKPFDERKDFAADAEYGERWPTTPGEVDTDSANHRRHEAFLDAQEWPGPENNWMSRRGHPLNPMPGEPRRIQWTDIYTLDAVEQERPISGSASSSDAGATTGPADDGVLVKHERTRHLLNQPAPPAPRHVIFGGGAEALDIDFARAGGPRTAGEARGPLEYQNKLHQRTAHLQQRSTRVMDPAAARARADEALQIERRRLQPFVEAGVHHTGSELYGTRGEYGGSLRTPAQGFRPGSAAARRASGGRPTSWPPAGWS